MATKTNELREKRDLKLEICMKIYDMTAESLDECDKCAGTILKLVQSYLKKQMPKEKVQDKTVIARDLYFDNNGFNKAVTKMNKVLDDLTEKKEEVMGETITNGI